MSAKGQFRTYAVSIAQIALGASYQTGAWVFGVEADGDRADGPT